MWTSEVSHIVSIRDPGEELMIFPLSINVLHLAFFDVTSATGMVGRLIDPDDIPGPRHVAAILEFGRRLPKGARILVHCGAGISRSTAAALLLLVAQARLGDERWAFGIVKKLRPQAWPNRRIVQIGDRLLGCGGRLVKALDDMDAV